MSSRMTRETINFHQPFILPELPDPLPAGRYEVELEEERMEGLSFTAWRVVRTTLRHIGAANGLSFALDVGAETLRAAIASNEAHPSAPPPPEPEPVPPAAAAAPADRQEPPRTWRDLIIPPVVVPAAIGLAVIAAFILGPFQ
ncbi:hypothetical protein [Niveispirillum sp.]|uniref:hypothetical protein n=1 Tax=Niveispirillum sp. TaxID=1917217 RepID=UPI001B635B7D|nr:hypothetical protein [Niveispirillum sp.]MBP7338959.1 hypothetical protein [Niveispirillum sp.]